MKPSTDKTFRYGLGYSCHLSCVAGFVALLPFVGLGLLISGVVLLAQGQQVVGIVLTSVALVGCIAAYLLRQRDAMATIRAARGRRCVAGTSSPDTRRVLGRGGTVSRKGAGV